MKNITMILIFTIIIILLFSVTNEEFFNNSSESPDNVSVYSTIVNDDSAYYSKFYYNTDIFNKLIDNNKLTKPINKSNKFLFVTFENRNKEYVDIHNKNIMDYTKKWRYDYKFINHCDYNPYWCKIKIVLNELVNSNYDYVVWLDSDTSIKKHNVDINDIVNIYDSHIFVGSDNNKIFGLINAGVFIIKKSNIGINFLKDCLKNVKKICFNKNGSLKGLWAASCYEQGQMNLNIADKYLKYTTVLPNEYILNMGKCDDQTFIMHLYGGSDEARKECLSEITQI